MKKATPEKLHELITTWCTVGPEFTTETPLVRVLDSLDIAYMEGMIEDAFSITGQNPESLWVDPKWNCEKIAQHINIIIQNIERRKGEPLEFNLP